MRERKRKRKRKRKRERGKGERTENFWFADPIQLSRMNTNLRGAK